MEMEQIYLSVGNLLDLFRNGMLKANSEYQRGLYGTPVRKRNSSIQ